MTSKRSIRWRLLLPGLALITLGGCGPLFSASPASSEILDGPIDGLSAGQLAAFLAGDDAFAEAFSPQMGLGPVFNERSCVACHPGDGRGHPSTNLTRFGRGDGMQPDKFDYLIHLGGPQLQPHAIPGYQGERLPASATGISVRGGPLVTGLGLIEAIPDSVILEREDPDDLDGDGISGRANYIAPPAFLAPLYDHFVRRGTKLLGRFGRKATAITLRHQTANAYFHDMGISSDAINSDPYNPQFGGPQADHAADPEVSSATLSAVVFYLRTLRPPERHQPNRSDVISGERLFIQVGCERCHRQSMTTGESPIAPLANQEVKLYSDLLLHDMGSALADNFPEGQATGREWRTTPLWGLGKIGNLLGGTAYYLHDGRTTDLREAILVHGGEAEQARNAFATLPSTEQEQLLSFLLSL